MPLHDPLAPPSLQALAVGPISRLVVDLLTEPRPDRPPAAVAPIGVLESAGLQLADLQVADVRLADLETEDPLTDGDFQLALWLLYEVHYGDLPGVTADREWDPSLVALRVQLESRFEKALRQLVRTTGGDDVPDPDGLRDHLRDHGQPAPAVTEALRRMTASADPGRLARHLAREATREEYVDYLSQRAVYHLRESDPQSFVLARIPGVAKTRLAELQYDEYGAGRPERLHSRIYARGLDDLGMSTDVLDHVADAEPTVLCTVNAMSLFCLHRRLRGAAMGHLAYFEATSSLPCRFVATGARRLDLPAAVVDYYDEHVEADSVHEQVAIDDICGALVAAEPLLAGDVLFGALACRAVDAITADALFARWEQRGADRVEVAS